MLEDLEIDLGWTRERCIIDFFCQGFLRPALLLDPTCARLRRKIVELIVKAVIAEARGLQRAEAKTLVEVPLEERIETGISALSVNPGTSRGTQPKTTDGC